MILVQNMVLVLQKSKQVKTRIDLKRKWVVTNNGEVCLSGIWTLDAWVVALRLFCEQSFYGPRLHAHAGPKGWTIYAWFKGWPIKAWLKG